MKFKDYSWRNNVSKYLLILLSVLCIVLLKWFAIPVIFVLYVLFSFFTKMPMVTKDEHPTLDVTV